MHPAAGTAVQQHQRIAAAPTAPDHLACAVRRRVAGAGTIACCNEVGGCYYARIHIAVASFLTLRKALQFFPENSRDCRWHDRHGERRGLPAPNPRETPHACVPAPRGW